MERTNHIVITGLGGAVAQETVSVNDGQPAAGYYFFPDDWGGQSILVVATMESAKQEQMVWIGKRLRLTGKLYCMVNAEEKRQLYFIHYHSSDYESEAAALVND